MNVRRHERGLFASPVLIGAVTVLVAIVAVFLAYNANNGLPFVPRYSLHVQVADAEELTSDAEVHLAGGSLVGHVTGIVPGRTASGQPIAVLDLALNKNMEPLSDNSTWRIRLKGAIGLKYLQLTPGNSSQTLANGATVPISQTSSEVDLDQVLSQYDAKTREGVVLTTTGYGEAFAGRGLDINNAIGAFVPLVRDLGPVMRNLSSKRTDLAGFFHGLENFSSALVPVAQQQAQLYENLATTFTSLASVAVPFFQNWIRETPPTLQTVITRRADAPVVRPGHHAAVRRAGPRVRDAAPERPRPGRDVPARHPEPAGHRAATRLSNLLTGLAQHLSNFGKNPIVQQGLDRLTLTAQSLGPPLAFLTPAQTTCNYVTLFLRNTASLLSDPVATGTRAAVQRGRDRRRARRRVGPVAEGVRDARPEPGRRPRPAARGPVSEYRRAG